MAVILLLALLLLLVAVAVETLLQMVFLVVLVVAEEITAALLEVVVLVQAVKETLAAHQHQTGQDPAVGVVGQVALAVQTLVQLAVRAETDQQPQLLVLLLHTQGAVAVEVTTQVLALVGLAEAGQELLIRLMHRRALQILEEAVAAVEIRQ